MKTEKVRCMGLPEGVPVTQFETLKEAVAHVKGDETKIVNTLNLYGRQKDSLVNARDWLSEKVETSLGFKRLMKDGKTAPTADTEDSELETESKHLARFVTAAANGTKIAGLTVSGTKPEEKDQSVWSFLQTIINKHDPWPFDLNAATRVGKAKKLPQYAVDAARNIITNKSEAKWQKNFENGFDFNGIAIDPIAFAPFQTAVPKGASEADAAAVRKTNEENLARAVAAATEQRNAKSAQKTFA